MDKMKRPWRKWTAEEKERIILDIKRLGVVAGCRKHQISSTLYYDWLDKYAAHGLDGLRTKRNIDTDRKLKRMEKENLLLKEIIAEKELTIKMQEQIIKKKSPEWKKKGK